MTLKEAMSARHTVRKYKEEPLAANTVHQMQDRIQSLNRKYELNIQLVTENTEGLSPLWGRLMAKGVRNYLILAGPDTAQVDEKLGYASADLMLYAQTLGLNSWWIGGMYSHKGAKKNSTAGEQAKIIGIVALGYGAEQGTAHKSKSAQEVASYDGDAPDWFQAGVQAALLAPTAMNRQGFKIQGTGDQVRMTYADGSFSGADLGICKYHFELGAGAENFHWA